MRSITITCDDFSDEFTSVEKDMIEDFLRDNLGMANIEITQQEEIK